MNGYVCSCCNICIYKPHMPLVVCRMEAQDIMTFWGDVNWELVFPAGKGMQPSSVDSEEVFGVGLTQH